MKTSYVEQRLFIVEILCLFRLHSSFVVKKLISTVRVVRNQGCGKSSRVPGNSEMLGPSASRKVEVLVITLGKMLLFLLCDRARAQGHLEFLEKCWSSKSLFKGT